MCKALSWSPYLLTTHNLVVALVPALYFFNMASSVTAMSPEQSQAALRTLLEGPATNPPAGVVPDFSDPANLDIYVTLCNSLCFAFATLAVILRMYTKMFILRVLAWEDCRFYFLSYDVAAIHSLLLLRRHSHCMGKEAFGKLLLLY